MINVEAHVAGHPTVRVVLFWLLHVSERLSFSRAEELPVNMIMLLAVMML